MINFENLEKKHAPCIETTTQLNFIFSFFVKQHSEKKKGKQVIWDPSGFNPFEIYCGALESLLNLREDCFEMK